MRKTIRLLYYIASKAIACLYVQSNVEMIKVQIPQQILNVSLPNLQDDISEEPLFLTL